MEHLPEIYMAPYLQPSFPDAVPRSERRSGMRRVFTNTLSSPMQWLLILFVFAFFALIIFRYVSAFGASRWNRETSILRGQLSSTQTEARPRHADLSSLEGLPAPVRRYLRTVLNDGHPIATGVRLRHEGTFNAKETEERWRPFSSHQWVTTGPPGFLWHAEIAMAPGVRVYVHDAYVNGWGILHASILGLYSVAQMKDRASLAEGELMRYLAETVWYPSALLPGEGVTWEAVDDRSAYGRLEDGVNSVTLLFTFNEEGLVESIRSDARGRTVDGKVVPTPWLGRFSAYREWDGTLVPMQGEVAWVLEDGEKAYWRGEILDVEYEYANQG